MLLEVGLSNHQYFATTLPQTISEDTPMHLGPAFFNLLRSPRLLDTIESVIGSEIYLHPLQVIRIKVPEKWVPEGYWDGMTARVDWHQDLGVLLPEADESSILSVWLPITDATVENGCLMVVPGSHRDGLALHCQPSARNRKNMLHIPDQYVPLDRAIPVPLKRGGALIFNRRMIHSSLPNTSDELRWSFDLRYQPTGQPTGRPVLPGFVARSKQHPQSEVRDYTIWADQWRQARSQHTGKGKLTIHRWDVDSPVCL